MNPRERTNVTANPKSEEPTSSVTSSVEIQNETVAQSVVASSETVKEDNSFMLVDGEHLENMVKRLLFQARLMDNIPTHVI